MKILIFPDSYPISGVKHLSTSQKWRNHGL